jgi:hypothetical protein
MQVGAAEDQNVNESCIRRAVQCLHLNSTPDIRLKVVKMWRYIGLLSPHLYGMMFNTRMKVISREPLELDM